MNSFVACIKHPFCFLQGSVPYLWAVMERKRALKIPFTVAIDKKVCPTYV